MDGSEHSSKEGIDQLPNERQLKDDLDETIEQPPETERLSSDDMDESSKGQSHPSLVDSIADKQRSKKRLAGNHPEEQSMSRQPSISSSLPDIGKEQPPPLPRNCSYTARKLDWKRVYSPKVAGQGEPKLLKDQRCETDFTYERGSMDVTTDIRVSETDILSHGLGVLLKTKEESLKSIQLPNLRNVLNLMQLSPEELAAVQEWLDKKYELSLTYEKEIQALITFIKKILKEVKQLRDNVARYHRRIQRIENELSLHPSPDLLADLYKEVERLRSEIIKLDKEHGAVVKSKGQLQTLLNMEFQTHDKSENSLCLRLQNLKYENQTLRHLLDVLTNEAREVSSSLFKRLDKSLKAIKKLDGLLSRAKVLLEKRSNQTKQAQTNIQDQNTIVEDIFNSIDLIEQNIGSLRTNVDHMKNKSSSLTSHVVTLQDEINELLNNFNNISSNLTNQGELEEGKKEKLSQIKELFANIELEKKNAKKLEKNIYTLEKYITSTESKDRKEGPNIVSTSEREIMEDRESWEQRMIKFRTYFEEMDEVMMNIKDDEAEKKKTSREASRTEAIGEHSVNKGEETVRLTGKFICSDATSGEVVTKSGVCKILETLPPKDGEVKEMHGRGVRLDYAVGVQNLQSVPESATNQLHGSYVKYNLKDSEETSHES